MPGPIEDLSRERMVPTDVAEGSDGIPWNHSTLLGLPVSMNSESSLDAADGEQSLKRPASLSAEGSRPDVKPNASNRETDPIRVLAISGSLRAGASNTAILDAAVRIAPAGHARSRARVGS